EVFPPKCLFLSPIPIQHMRQQPPCLLFFGPFCTVGGNTCYQGVKHRLNFFLICCQPLTWCAFSKWWSRDIGTTLYLFASLPFKPSSLIMCRETVFLIILFYSLHHFICEGGYIVTFQRPYK